jgi:hypothetical protein
LACADLQLSLESLPPVVRVKEARWKMKVESSNRGRKLNLRVGDWVEVRSKEEILKTLDSKGQIDGMPFMPEMFSFCGKRFQVYKSAHKTCDTVFPTRGRRVDEAVHLETRCDGQAHGGCEAACLLFWKEAWLKPVQDGSPASSETLVKIQGANGSAAATTGCAESDVWAAAQKFDTTSGETKYECQATQLPYMTRDLDWWDLSQYVDDYLSGNVGLWRMFCGLVYSAYYALIQAGIGLGPVLRWFYDKAHPLWRGTKLPRKAGTIPVGQPTPAGTLNLQPGELVRVKSHEAILATLNTENKNRGICWDAELVPFCGGTYRVHSRVHKIVNEKTGKMQEMKNPCIILEAVVCEARYSNCRMFCPRSIYPYWREIWLERVAPNLADNTEVEGSKAQEPPAAIALQEK